MRAARNVLVGDVREWVGIEPVGKIETRAAFEALVVVSGDKALLLLCLDLGLAAAAGQTI